MTSAARMYYRMVTAGIELHRHGDRLDIKAPNPLTETQRLAVRDHKADLIELADWYSDDDLIIKTLTEDQFIDLAEHYLNSRTKHRSTSE